MELKYIKGDLFELSPEGAYLAHACNAQGVWGRGIAQAFRELYPEDYIEYKKYCSVGRVGTTLITKNRVICLITSTFYDKERLSLGDTILSHTSTALMDLEFSLPKDAVVYSNKFNSGLFNVPWEHTEYFLKCFLERRPDISWVVCVHDPQ